MKELDTEVLLPLYKQSNTPNVKFGEWETVLSASDKFRSTDNNESFKMEQAFHGFDKFNNSILSISVVSVQDKEEKQRTIDRIKLILSKHNMQETDTLTLPYTVMIYWCQRT